RIYEVIKHFDPCSLLGTNVLFFHYIKQWWWLQECSCIILQASFSTIESMCCSGSIHLVPQDWQPL
ncbi:hypothetical protein NDU88_004486, partial [Pleurodeles waltl]